MFINVRILILSIVLLFGAFDYVLESYLKIGFLEKNNKILLDLQKNITDIDNEMSVSLSNGARYLEKYMLLNPKITRDDLTRIKDEINATVVSIFDENGKFYLTTGRALDPTYEHYNFYKAMSVLNLEECNEKYFAEQSHRDKCKAIRSQLFQKSKIYPNNPLTTQLFLSAPRMISNKMVVLYNQKLKKFFDVSYNSSHIDNFLKQHLVMHNEIVYFALIDQNGKDIFKTGNLENQNADIMKKTFSVGKNLECVFLGNSCSYTLQASFSKSELNHKINNIRLVLGSIVSFLLLCVYIGSRSGRNRRVKS